jgi:phosphosulfolactate phosphohydrolase-like enzyme
MNLDDTFVAGRIVELLGWERTDAADAAARLVGTWRTAEEAFRASKSGRNLMENAPELEEDIPFCARESVLGVVPRLVALHDTAAEIAS